MNKGWKKAAALLLCTSLAATSLSGCSKKAEASFDAEATVMTVNEEAISAGLVKFASSYSQAQYQYLYDTYFGDNSVAYEITTGYTIGDMIIEGALDTVLEAVLARQNMAEYDVELTAEEEAAITEAATAFMTANDEEVLELISATQEIVEEYLTLITIQNKVELAIAETVDTEVSDEEAQQRRVKYVLITAETEDETEEDTEEAESEAAEEVVEEAVVETEAETLVEAETVAETETAGLEENDATKTQSAEETEVASEAAEEETEGETEDPAWTAAMEVAYAQAMEIITMIEEGMDFDVAVSVFDDTLSTHEITFGSDSTSVASGLVSYTEGLDDDTLVTEPIEASSGYYVAMVVYALDREATDEEKESIIEDRIEEAISDLMTEWEDSAETETDSDVFATITIDINLTQVEEEETEVAEGESEVIEVAAETEAAEAQTE